MLDKYLSNESRDLPGDLGQVNSWGFSFPINESKGEEAGYMAKDSPGSDSGSQVPIGREGRLDGWTDKQMSDFWRFY